MATVVAEDGLEGVPSLEDICQLFRSIVNDSFSNGAGQISTDTAPWMLPFLNSAIRDLYSDLRMINDMKVIVDNAIVAIPALATADPSVQVALTYQGYYNGVTTDSSRVLPANLMWLLKAWQRPTGSGATFFPLQVAPAGLQGVYQGGDLGQYEIRGNNQMWMNGSTVATDLRLRYMATFPNLLGGNINFNTTYVPLTDCTNAVAFKMVAYYAQRLSPDQFQLAESQAQKFTKKMLAESVLNSQVKQFQRQPFGL